MRHGGMGAHPHAYFGMQGWGTAASGSPPAAAPASMAAADESLSTVPAADSNQSAVPAAATEPEALLTPDPEDQPENATDPGALLTPTQDNQPDNLTAIFDPALAGLQAQQPYSHETAAAPVAEDVLNESITRSNAQAQAPEPGEVEASLQPDAQAGADPCCYELQP